MNRQIVHMDMDAFFVSCTLRKMPKLTGKPLIIGGANSRGIVMSASYEARQYGVHRSMPTRVALQRCPDAVLVKGDFDLFSRYSDTVNEIIAEKAPVHERATLDEFYLDMTGMDRFHSSYTFSKELAHTIYDETGLPLSFGLSINKTVAKICTEHIKPAGHLQIAKQEVQPFLDPQSVRKLPSVGETTYRLLRRMSIKVIGTLRQVPMTALQELFGKPGITIWKKANGIDTTPVTPYQQQKSFSEELTLDQDTQDIRQLKAILVTLVEKVGFQMRKQKQICAKISVRIRYTNFDTETVQRKIPFTSFDHTLALVAKELFDKLYQRRMLIRMIGVKLSDLVQGNHQIDLFHDDFKMIRLTEAMDKLKFRYDDPMIIRKANGATSDTFS
ncbi:MAG: DNA polymerase IV [Cyclobacteriaceae bacterium]